MSPFTLATLLVFTGILFVWWYATHHRRYKLPPGPLPLPIIGNLHLLGDLPHRTLHKLSQKYGPIMSIRLGFVQAVVVSSPEAAKLFLGTHDAVFASRPKVQAAEYLYNGGKGKVFTEYGPYWRSVRKFCKVELLSAAKIGLFAGMRREELGAAVEEIRVAAAAREVVNLSEKVGEVIEDWTCRMLFGRKSDQRFDMKSIIDEAMEMTGAFNLGDYVPFLAPLDLQGLTQRFKRVSKTVDQMLETIIDEHEQGTLTENPQQHKDFIAIMLSQMKESSDNAQDQISHPIKSNMKAILLDVIAGSIDTSKTAITWILSELLRHPRVMKKLQKELQTIIGDDKMVDETHLSKLDYLHMVIMETLRLYPVASLLAPHESMEDILINGYHIPKKSRLIVNYWAFGRDPKVWSENCEEFLPERFIGSKIDLRGHDLQLIPFGTGRRGCPGMHLGLLNIDLVVAQLVHSFDWKLPNGMSPCDLDMKEKFGLAMPRATDLLALPVYRK